MKCVWETLSSFKAADNKLVTWDLRQKFYFEIIMLFSEKSDMSGESSVFWSISKLKEPCLLKLKWLNKTSMLE